MDYLIGSVIIAATLVCCFTAIRSLCADYASLRPWQHLLWGAVAIWTVVTIHRVTVWAEQPANAVGYDGILHDQIAREIADGLQSGEWSLTELRWLSNDGYRSMLAIIYWFTDAPLPAAYAIHSLLAFLGLLYVLESCAYLMNVERFPLWLVIYIILLPSALIFTPMMLKEGPVLWGIGAILRAAVAPEIIKQSKLKLGITLFAVLIAGLLRPHIIAAWLAAYVASRWLSFTSPMRAIIGMVLIVATFWGLLIVSDYVMPGISDKVKDVGVVKTLDKMSTMSQGGSAIYRARTPIPVLDGLLFVFFEPNPLMWGNLSYAIVGVETWMITLAIAYSWLNARDRVKLILDRRMMLCVVSIVLVGFYLGYMYNLGLMVRQRLQIMPALVLLVALLRKTPAEEWENDSDIALSQV